MATYRHNTPIAIERGVVLVPGIAIGILIGIVSALVTLVLLKPAASATTSQTNSVLLIGAELLAIPTFWFGGPWVTTTLLKLVKLDDFLIPYTLALAVTYAILICYPTMKWIVRLGNVLGNDRS